MRKLLSISCIGLGVLLIVGGAATWLLVGSVLGDQKITTSEDACLPGRSVTGPFTAYCEARVIEEHVLQSTDGLHYAELERDDPRRETALTASFLQASLFTSVVAFGIAAMAAGVGVVFVLIGFGIRDVQKLLA